MAGGWRRTTAVRRRSTGRALADAWWFSRRRVWLEGVSLESDPSVYLFVGAPGGIWGETEGVEAELHEMGDDIVPQVSVGESASRHG